MFQYFLIYLNILKSYKIHRQQLAADQRHPPQQVLRVIPLKPTRKNFSCHSFSLILSSSYPQTRRIRCCDLCWCPGMLPAIPWGFLAQALSDPQVNAGTVFLLLLQHGNTLQFLCAHQICFQHSLGSKSSLYSQLLGGNS